MRKSILTSVALSIAMLLSPLATISAQNHRGQSGNNRGGTSVSRPGGNNGNHNGNRPGGNNGNHNGNRPGWNNGNHNGWGNHWGGTSVPRPGVGATPSPRPGYGHRPPRINRWERPLPPPPPRVSYVPVAVPSIRNVLGLAFGTMIDYGINALLTSGYNVAGTWDNTIFLNNVQQFGVVWPEATIYYGPNGMQSARFQYWSYAPNNYTFNSVYNALRAAYGNPLSTTSNYGTMTYIWWGGNNTGYITLQYGPGEYNGGYRYYTDLIYGN